MDKTRISVAIFIIILFVSMIVFVIYNNSVLEEKNKSSEGQLVANLGIVEIKGEDSNLLGQLTPIPYNYLYITGIVNNTAGNTIYNAGLLVAAYDSEGNLLFNMTFPLALRGVYGSDNATNEYVSNNITTNDVSREVLDSNYSAYVTISILHKGTATNWNMKPVWTNTP